MKNSINEVSLSEAVERLAELGDDVKISTLSRYVTKYADAIQPKKRGKELVLDFEVLVSHRRENINLAQPPGQTAAQKIAGSRSDEAAQNIRAQRLLRELDLAERAGTLTPTCEVEEAAHAAVGMLRGAFGLALNDTAEAIAALTGVEARLIRPHLRAFEKKGLDAFLLALADYELTQPASA